MRTLALSTLALLTACGPNFVDRWDGECVINLDGTEIKVELEIDIEEVKGGKVEGTVELSFPGAGPFDGDVSGDVDGKDIDWDLEFNDPEYEGETRLEGTLDDKETITGDCNYQDVGGTYDGDFELQL